MRVQNRLMGVLATIVASVMMVGCSNNPTTGGSQFTLLSRSQEIALGEQAKSQLSSEYGGRVADESVQAYLTEICMSMVEHTEGDWPTLPWEFTLLDSPVVNAFALPGGKTFMSRGLAEKLKNEAELAFIMGHEIGHVTARHGNQRISQQMLAAGVAIGIGVAAQSADSDAVKYGVPLAVGAGTGMYLLSYGRSQELQSDKLGLRYMVRAGYNPQAGRAAMQLLADLAQGAERQAEMFSTHPHPERRIADIEREIAKNYSAQANDPNYEFFEQRYQQRMLRPLAALPQSTGPSETFALHDSMTWCGVCQAEAKQKALAAADER